MKPILLTLITLISHSLFSQILSNNSTTYWSVDKTKKCEFRNSTLTLNKDKTFILVWWDGKVFDLGTYSIDKDTLILNQTHVRDYYEGNGSKESHNSISRYLIQGRQLIPFFQALLVGKKYEPLLSKPDVPCSFFWDSTKTQ